MNFARHFASDNYAGICPEVFESFAQANRNHAPSYGADEWTAKAVNDIRDVFETECAVHFVFNGSAANSLILSSMCDSFGAVVCHEFGHIANDECNAPGFFRHGLSLLPTQSANGKLTPELVEATALRRTDVHAPKAQAVSVTNATEVGTVYTVSELGAVGEKAKSLGLKMHLDGARFSNGVASLGVAPADITWRVGVDAMCFGGTKNGMGFGEAIVIFSAELAENFDYRVKQSGQLASKHRFLSSQWHGFLQNEVWLRNARNANAAARRLRAGLEGVPGVRIAFPTEANAVFAYLPPKMADALLASGRKFYTDVGPNGCARLMCAWDTTFEDVDGLVEQVRTLAV
ncbi:MAG TPA: low specificity L-threonine aldolase [Chthoniobacterales bacterium]